MKLTDEQVAAVHHDSHAAVVACPGSGKTRSIIARLLRSVDAIRDSTRRVACITYTKAAVFEIENRIRLSGSAGDDEYCDVSTIHAFCQNNILRYFHWKLEEYSDGFTVLPSDSEQYREIVNEIGETYRLDSYSRQNFELLNRRPSGEPITPGNIPAHAAIEFWDRLQAEGYIDFCNLVYFSYRLLLENPGIVQGLAAKYAFILVDEFQDTSALQVEILSLIAAEGRTQFFLVGDPEQSIYSFAGAERQLMFDFASKLGAVVFPIPGNFRSSPPIIRTAESLIPRTPPMLSAGDSRQFTEQPIYEHCLNPFAGITDTFLPTLDALQIPVGEAAILAPSWYPLRPLGTQLRDYGIPVVGPGARPYRRSHVFAGLAEQVCAFIESPRSTPIRQVEKALFDFLQNATGKPNFRVFDFDGRRVAMMLLEEAARLRDNHEGALVWLKEASIAFSLILHAEEFLPRHCLELLPESARDIVRDMRGHRNLDVSNLTTSDLGMFANPEHNLKLLTMHRSKGREFTAVALISLHDGIIPYHNQYNPLTDAKVEEARRLLYVAITRAKRLLVLFTDSEDYRNPTRYLREMRF